MPEPLTNAHRLDRNRAKRTDQELGSHARTLYDLAEAFRVTGNMHMAQRLRAISLRLTALGGQVLLVEIELSALLTERPG